jgi:hypothetical protein
MRKTNSAARCACRQALSVGIFALLMISAGAVAARAQNPAPEPTPAESSTPANGVPLVSVPPDYEDFTGDFFLGVFSYMHVNPGHSFPESQFVGWDGQLTEWANPWFGLAIDTSGHYGKISYPFGPTGPHKVGADQVSAGAGPKLRLIRTKRYAGSVYGIMGMGRNHVDERDLGTGLQYNDQFKLAFTFGAMVDVRLSRRWAWKVQPDLYLSRIAHQTHPDFRFATGPVIRFGVP